MIDKSSRQHYEMQDKVRTGYAFGGTGGRTSSSSSNGSGNNEMENYRAAQFFAPKLTPVKVSPIQSMAMTGNATLAGKTQEQAQASVDRDNASIDRGKALYGGPTVKEALKKAEVTKMIRDQALEKMDVIPDDTTQLDLNKFDIKSIRNTIPKTGLENSLLNNLMPKKKKKKGIWGTLGSIALGILAPQLLPAKFAKAYTMYNQAKGLSKFASNFTGKNIVEDLTSNLKRKKFTTDTKENKFGDGDGDGDKQVKPPIENIIEENIQKFSPEQKDMMKKHSLLQGVIKSGSYQGKQLTSEQLQKVQQESLSIQKLIEQYLVPVAHGGLIDKPLMGRNRYI